MSQRPIVFHKPDSYTYIYGRNEMLCLECLNFEDGPYVNTSIQKMPEGLDDITLGLRITPKSDRMIYPYLFSINLTPHGHYTP